MTDTAIDEAEVLPWDKPYIQTPTIYGRVHVLAPTPSVTFNPRTYPSLEIAEHSGEDVAYAGMVLSLTGTEEQRWYFAKQLRAVADAIEAWTPADGRAES